MPVYAISLVTEEEETQWKNTTVNNSVFRMIKTQSEGCGEFSFKRAFVVIVYSLIVLPLYIWRVAKKRKGFESTVIKFC